MDKELYYIIAVVLASTSALISAINLLIILRDRKRKVSFGYYVCQGSGNDRTYTEFDLFESKNPITSYRTALLISNDSFRPFTVQSVSVLKRERKLFFFWKERRVSADIEFTGGNMPITVDGQSAKFVEFGPEVLRNYQGEYLALRIGSDLNRFRIPTV